MGSRSSIYWLCWVAINLSLSLSLIGLSDLSLWMRPVCDLPAWPAYLMSALSEPFFPDTWGPHKTTFFGSYFPLFLSLSLGSTLLSLWSPLWDFYSFSLLFFFHSFSLDLDLESGLLSLFLAGETAPDFSWDF